MPEQFTLRKKQDVKVGSFVRYKGDEPVSNHWVVVRTETPLSYGRQTLSVWVDDVKATEIHRSGNGRNLTWQVDNSGQYGSTLDRAVERAVASYLYQKDYAAEVNSDVDWIKGSLPYEFDKEADALDFAFGSENEGSTNVPVIGRYKGTYYVGFHYAEITEDVVAAISGEVEYFDARVYGTFDPRLVIAALEEQGFRAHFDRDYTGVEVYVHGDRGAVKISKDGAVEYVAWNDEGNSGPILTASQSVAESVAAARLWLKQAEAARRATDLLAWLEAEVPDGVAHFAVEGVKHPLRVLAANAHTVDFNYGR